MSKLLIAVVFSVLLLVPVGALNAFAGNGNAVRTDHFPCTRAEITITFGVPAEQEIVELIGPSTVVVRFDGPFAGIANDDDGNRLDDVLTEIVAMRLEGTGLPFGQLLLTQSLSFQSTGFLEEDIDNQFTTLDVPPFNSEGFTATSSFDVFFDFEILADPAGPLHNGPNDPMLLEGQITHITPRADDVLVANNIVPLLDGNNNPSGPSIGPVVLTLNPNCFPPAFDVGPMQPHNTVFPATVGVPIAPLPVSCTDPEVGAFVILENLGLPPGASVTLQSLPFRNSATQTFSYTPISPGIQIVTFTCNDFNGASAIHVYNFDIRTASPVDPCADNGGDSDGDGICGDVDVCPNDPLNQCNAEVIGGEIIPIETTSLILAGTQTFSWMIPVLLSGIGIGLFAVSRKSENS